MYVLTFAPPQVDGLLYSVGLDSTDEILTALSTTCEGSGDTCYETNVREMYCRFSNYELLEGVVFGR